MPRSPTAARRLPAGGWFRLLSAAGQQTARQGAPDQDPETLGGTHGQEIPLEIPGHQAVVRLDGGIAVETAALGDTDRLGDLPGRVVGAGQVADLAVPYQLVEGAERLLHGGAGVEAVDVVQVDPVGTEAAQAGLASPQDVPAGLADVVRAVAHPGVHLGADEDLVAPTSEGPSQELLGLAALVGVGGVEQVDAGVEGHRHLVPRAGEVDRPDRGAGVPETHGAEGQGRHPDARRTQEPQFQRPPPRRG